MFNSFSVEESMPTILQLKVIERLIIINETWFGIRKKGKWAKELDKYVYSQITILPTKKIGTSQLISSNIPKAKLLAIAPILPKQVIIQIATAPTCVGNMSTTMLLITKFAVTIVNENMQLTIKICKEDSTKYIAKPNIPANNMVVTETERNCAIFKRDLARFSLTH